MSVPLYVPALPARQHAAHAYRELTPGVQRQVAPLWTLPPRPWTRESAALEERVRADISLITRVQRHHPGWLDALFADCASAPYHSLLPEYWRLTPLRPVTGPERPLQQQQLALASGSESGNGLGIRIRLTGHWDDAVVTPTRTLLGAVDKAAGLDLLLDLSRVLGDRPDAGKEALRALDALLPLADWRCAAVISGGYPERPADVLDADRGEVSRSDWDLWDEIQRSERAYLSGLRYGDYAALPASGIAATPEGGGPAPWGILRYTAERTFLLAKVPTRGEGRAALRREAARWITSLNDYRGPYASAGDRWLRDCAQGVGSQGTGNPGVWNRVGNSQHMTYVVRQLAMGSQ